MVARIEKRLLWAVFFHNGNVNIMSQSRCNSPCILYSDPERLHRDILYLFARHYRDDVFTTYLTPFIPVRRVPLEVA